MRPSRPVVTYNQRDVRVADGRTLRLLEDGDPDGRPVFVLHGTPGCRLLYRKHVEDAVRRGLRLIGYDRPGYGGSTAMRGRRVVDAAHDVRAIADVLSLKRFAVWGHSSGGHHALACAAALPERVVAVASLAGDSPYSEVSAEGIDWFRGMSEWQAGFFRQMINDPAAWEAELVVPAVDDSLTPEQIRKSMSAVLSDVDRAAFTNELVEYVRSVERENRSAGTAGARDDSLAEVRPWGFEVSSIRVPVQLWHGRQDRFVPISMGEWLATHIPRVDVHLEADEGHLTLFEQRIPAVHEWLSSQF